MNDAKYADREKSLCQKPYINGCRSLNGTTAKIFRDKMSCFLYYKDNKIFCPEPANKGTSGIG